MALISHPFFDLGGIEVKILSLRADSPRSKEIQKDGEVVNSILESLTFIEEDKVYEEGCTPVDVAVSIRSAYTNKVLLCPYGEAKRMYHNITRLPEVSHKGYDLVTYYASIATMQVCDFSKILPTELSEKVMLHSKFDFLGVYNPNPDLINPILYCQVILKDDTVDTFESVLKEGYEMKDIESFLDSCKAKTSLEKSLVVVGKKDDK